MPDNGKWLAICAISALIVSILFIASLSLFGYTFYKIELPGGGKLYINPPSKTLETKPFTEESNISIKIIYPGPNDLIDHAQPVTGNFSGKLPEGSHAWLLSSYSGRPTRWWEPHGEIPDKDSWAITAYIGAPVNENIGNKYEIAAVLVNDEWHDYFNYYKKYSEDKKCWSGVPLPDDFPIKYKIEVIRK